MVSKILLTLVAIAMAASMGAGSAFADEDLAKVGEKTFKRKCKLCHEATKEKNKLGPNLVGIIGRKAGTVESFKKYSDALKNSGVVWDEESLTKWIAKPKEFIPGNNMKGFPGFKKEKDRQAVVAYLKSLSAN